MRITIDEAIRILENFEDPLRLYSVDERKVAARLGVEALKRWKEFRGTGSLMDKMLLPGEKEE
jgi:hypothetical protein